MADKSHVPITQQQMGLINFFEGGHPIVFCCLLNLILGFSQHNIYQLHFNMTCFDSEESSSGYFKTILRCTKQLFTFGIPNGLQ